MSELIDNRRHRVDALKGIIHELHDGVAPEALKERFRAVLDHVGAGEISTMESELMAEGMPEQEIKRMCELHVAVFRDKLEQRPAADTLPGHPVHTFRRENQALLQLTRSYRDVAAALGSAGPATVAIWRDIHERLALVEVHYKRKEFLVFPFLEKAGITAPPKVMWSLHDDIRASVRAAGDAAAGAAELDAADLALVRDTVLLPMLDAVEGMVEKEERVLFPMALETLAETEWGSVQAQWDEFGPGLVEPEAGWRPAAPVAPASTAPVAADDAITLPSGHLTLRQLTALLNALPVDLTFVDADDRVAFFSEGRERVFPRNRAIIGRRVQDCHPPASLHIVQRVVDELRSGARDVAEFWIEQHGRFVDIRYFAVRDEAGAYLGCLEVTQDATALRTLTGERRLLDEVTP